MTVFTTQGLFGLFKFRVPMYVQTIFDGSHVRCGEIGQGRIHPADATALLGCFRAGNISPYTIKP